MPSSDKNDDCNEEMIKGDSQLSTNSADIHVFVAEISEINQEIHFEVPVGAAHNYCHNCYNYCLNMFKHVQNDHD